ncbi:MAG TPA: hypothetical protein VKF37_03070 [Chloroflexota bacterium]|nr:hypothetical protein [Chloroflexota bacterium]
MPPSPNDGDLSAGLRAWQSIMARCRLVAVLRRWAIVALTLALLLAVPGRLSAGLPAWIIAGGPAVLLVAGVALGARRLPSLTTVARVLDHHLALKEQVASALALSGSADVHGPLGARLEARAAALIGQARREWTARPVLAGGEWVALVAASAVLALLLVAPRPAPSRPAALATGGAPAAQAFATTSSRAHLPVQMRVAVVSTPPAGTSVRGPISGSRVQPRRQGAQVAARQGAGRTQESRGQEAPGARAGAAAAGGTTASSSQQHGTLPLVSGRPNAPPTVRGRNGAGSGRGGQGRSAASGGHGPLQAAQRGRAGGAGQRGSSPASGAPGHAQPGTIPRGKGLRSPYGGPLPGIGVRQKPGLVIGRALYAGSAHGRGSNSAGRGRAPLGGPSAARPLRATGGHQLSLQSAYGGAPGAGDPARSVGRRSGPTPTDQRGNTAHVVSGQSEAPATDYIPPDANAVAPGDRAVVAGYFTPRSTS